MKLAEVTCSAKSRSTTHRVPDTGNQYRFRSGQSTSVSDMQDARYFDRRNPYTVEWTARGKLKSMLIGEEDSAEEAIKSFSYDAKQSLAKAFGIKANQDDETLTEELTGVAEDMKKEMEEY